VHLYDVIETDKYIGIILEYASGGELFDHILAHRYLKERDACKLFAQLISAVWYLHQKKIVHRDLKLENLLLDRHRNVIVTDFGFANRFEHRTDDLMQTSCGSPCYAAPELVISEGLYVGSAVDIWSCGVILYAMLAGYLPFDDDPANPEGDNINLLYKYILSTQLTFPDYVSAEARDLLSKMLVPDPQSRADLQTVMSHEWLSPYASLFGRSIEEYESVAQEQQMQKRANYQRQIRERDREIQRALKAQQREQHRQHAHTDPRSTKSTGGYAGQMPMEVEDPDMFTVPTSISSRRAVASAIIMPTSTGAMEDLIMTGPSNVESQRNGDERARKESRASERRSGKGKEAEHREKKGAGPSSKGGRAPPGGFRHTIQLEYDDGGERAEVMPPPPSRATGKRRHDEEDVVMQNTETFERSRKESSGPRLSQAATPVPPIPGPLPAQVPQPQGSLPTTRMAGPSTQHALVRNAATEPALSTYKPANESRSSLRTPPADMVINTDVTVTASTTPFQSPMTESPITSTTSTPSSSSNKPSKHGRGMSIDRFNISKLLHGKDSNGEEKKEKEESKKRPSRKGSETSSNAGSNAGAGMAGIGAGGGIPTPPASAPLTSRSNLSVASGGATGTSTLDQTSVGKGTSKRRGGKALSLVVDPITRYVASILETCVRDH
jgi:protein-serine/threonine kinase